MAAVPTELTATSPIPSARTEQSRAHRVTQNWVLDPIQDAVFIIAAPVLVLLVAVILFAKLGATQATSFIIVAHVILTVAHHLPTFIRVYGDVDLFKRFKWHFVLAPIFPFVISAVVLAYLGAHQLPVENFLYLYIFLALWDPWHFLRQHYGFMRIYDRSNGAPARLASQMDWWISVAWFVYIMLASGTWLVGLLRDMYINANYIFILGVSARALETMTTVSSVAAMIMSAIYAAYLVWCWRAGYFVSAAKIGLLIAFFAVMYLTYTPNSWIASLAPGWSFKVGFATIGIVHMTQYLAIVWRYNRRIASPESASSRARVGLFTRWHGTATKVTTATAAMGYVVVCLTYGDVITTKHDNRALMSVLLAIGFTSTLLHYYFDGFIWKVRHHQNREALDLAELNTKTSSVDGDSRSWWASPSTSPTKVLARQFVYFGIPMSMLTIGAVSAWHQPKANYIDHMYRAQLLSENGHQQQAIEQARRAFADMNAQLPLTAKLVELESTSARDAELAFLIYNQSLYENIVLPQISGHAPNTQQRDAHRDKVREAIAHLSAALEKLESLAHEGRETLTRDDAQRVLASWRKQL